MVAALKASISTRNGFTIAKIANPSNGKEYVPQCKLVGVQPAGLINFQSKQ